MATTLAATTATTKSLAITRTQAKSTWIHTLSWVTSGSVNLSKAPTHAHMHTCSFIAIYQHTHVHNFTALLQRWSVGEQMKLMLRIRHSGTVAIILLTSLCVTLLSLWHANGSIVVTAVRARSDISSNNNNSVKMKQTAYV